MYKNNGVLKSALSIITQYNHCMVNQTWLSKLKDLENITYNINTPLQGTFPCSLFPVLENVKCMRYNIWHMATSKNQYSKKAACCKQRIGIFLAFTAIFKCTTELSSCSALYIMAGLRGCVVDLKLKSRENAETMLLSILQ